MIENTSHPTNCYPKSQPLYWLEMGVWGLPEETNSWYTLYMLHRVCRPLLRSEKDVVLMDITCTGLYTPTLRQIKGNVRPMFHFILSYVLF